MISNLIIIFIIVFAIGSCGNKTTDDSKKDLTQEQRDSVLAESHLPGSGTVGKAIEASDSASAKKDRLDDLVN